MAKSIVTYCDICLADDQYVNGSTRTIALDNRKPRTIDLCDVHVKEYVEPLDDLLAKLGLTDTKAAKRGPVETRSAKSSSEEPKPPAVTKAVCDDCGVTYEWPGNKRPAQALGVHRKRKHGIAAKPRTRRKASA